MKTYEKYKDSGVEWLGEIPEYWEVFRMKRLFYDFSKKNFPNEELLSVTQNQGVVPRSWVENRMVMPSGALESFKLIEKGDFAISLRSFEGGIEYCYHTGIISPAYTVLKKNKNNLLEFYYKYLFKSYSFISELQTSVVGIREGKNISYKELSYSFLPIPPLSEQEAIAKFLDEKTEKIDKAIGIKEKQIDLLKERKQILIHDAVTQGLNKNVTFKDSGIDWIGKIPEHWEVKRLKYLGRIKSGEPAVNSSLSDNYQYEVYGGNGVMGHYNKYNVDGLNIVIGRVGAYCGNVRLINDKKWISDNALILNIKDEKQYLFITFVLKAGNLNELNTSNAQPLITGNKVLNFNIPIPPLSEQEEIAEYIETASQKIDKAVSLKQQEIEKLKEYKSSLINSVVTGKVRV